MSNKYIKFISTVECCIYYREMLKRNLYIYFSPSFRNIFSVRCEYRVKKKKGNRKFFSKRWKVQMPDDLNKFDLKRKGKISFRKFSFLRFPRKLNFRIKRFSALDIEVEFNFERKRET